MRYGITPENLELIRDKAREKKNGVYRFRGIVYRVKDKKVTHVAGNGRIFEHLGHFNVEIGNYAGYADAAAKIMRTI